MTRENDPVRYYFRSAVGGFFEFPTDYARALLPAGLQPVEPHHGSAVLSVMAFDFTDSMVGAYQELILSILVSPRIEPGAPMPHSAFYPFLLGTTTTEAREHAIERWHLPHYMRDIAMRMEAEGDRIRVAAWDDRGPILEMTVTAYEWSRAEQSHQSFMRDEDGAYMAVITMAGELSESEEERGELVIHEHPFTEALELDEVSTVPFRELWMRDGLQTFQPLRVLPQTAGV